MNTKLQDMNDEIKQLTTLVSEIDEKITIYSTIDMVRVKDLSEQKRELELLLLDLMNDTNEIWLKNKAVA